MIMLIHTFNNAECNREDRATDIYSSRKNRDHPPQPYACC